ncbi:MAG: FHA domain-containing protein [Chloroflexi bacterium]|nr:MAG: hypothetical protein CUN54_02740 [Phototrophicales bacterium]RMF80888.1 MAG: FHA domain-containing protein [Chloroflexota bacterium]
MNKTRTCLVCQHENDYDATKCVHCGSPLRIGKTMRLSDEAVDQFFSNYVDEAVQLAPGAVALYFVGRDQPEIINVHDSILLGRGNIDVPGMIDLNRLNAGLLGVSRRHALIKPSDGGYAIEDLDSTNGTWVNEQRIPHDTPQPLRSGDQIRLGHLIFFIQFAT